jgi:hypothetical protein
LNNNQTGTTVQLRLSVFYSVNPELTLCGGGAVILMCSTEHSGELCGASRKNKGKKFSKKAYIYQLHVELRENI